MGVWLAIVSILELSHLHYPLSSFVLEIDFLKVYQGEYIVIVGQTGSGKTVLLECIAGIRSLKQGRMTLAGKEETNSPSHQRQIGFAYQDSLLFPFLTVEENILFSAKARKCHRDPAIVNRLISLVDRMGIAHLLSRYPQNLSGGERQRVSLARAILLQPPILLLDEPLSALDVNTRNEMSKLLKEIHQQENMTIIHVTHDLSEALQLGTRMIILKQGQILESGHPTTLYMRPTKLETAVFLRVENLIPVHVVRSGDGYSVQYEEGCIIMENRIRLTEGEHVLGIRSGSLTITPPREPYHPFVTVINQASFNGQSMIVQCGHVLKWEIAVPLSIWQELGFDIGSEVTLYGKLQDLLFYQKEDNTFEHKL